MKRLRTIVGTSVIITILAWIIVSWTIARVRWIRSYGQAEPLVQQVWPLSQTIKNYHLVHGYNPSSLKQLTEATTNAQILELEQYHPEFTPEGTTIFKMTVNERFGFSISSEYEPKWIESGKEE